MPPSAPRRTTPLLDSRCAAAEWSWGRSWAQRRGLQHLNSGAAHLVSVTPLSSSSAHHPGLLLLAQTEYDNEQKGDALHVRAAQLSPLLCLF